MSDDLSIEKMLEAAMGLSMGSLFAKSMNETYAKHAVRVNNNQTPEPPKFMYAIIEGKQQGPFSIGEVLSLIQQGMLTLDSYIWKPGMAEWKKASEVDGLQSTQNVEIPEPPIK